MPCCRGEEGKSGGVRRMRPRPGEESIRLGQLLKLVDAVPSGAQVKDVLTAGDVSVNGEPEERRRRQVRRGAVVAVAGQQDVHISCYQCPTALGDAARGTRRLTQMSHNPRANPRSAGMA